MKKALPLLLVCAAAGGAWWAWKPAEDGGKKGPNAVTVVFAQAETQDVPLRLEVSGRTEAYESVTLKARVDGQVKAVPFAPGQAVKAGELLVQLDPADYQAKLHQAEATLAKSQAQALKAKADLERYIGLRTKNFISEEKLGDVKTNAAATEAAAQADAAAAETARLQASYTRVVAPFAGIVGARLVSPGAAVRANDTTLAVVNRIKPLYIAFAVPEKYLPQLQASLRNNPNGKKSLPASITVPGSADALAAEVNFIDNGVDTSTGTVQMKAQLGNEKETLAPGQFVNVSLVLDTLKQAVTVPAEAVQQGSSSDFVFVVKDGAAEVRKVKVVTVQKGVAVIAEGLAAGDTVVREGQLRLTPGAKVKAAEVASAGKDKKP